MSSKIVLFLINFLTISAFANNQLIDVLFSGSYEFIDLSYPYDNDTVYWPDAKKFEFTHKDINEEPFWVAVYDYSSGEHCGTHLDAPFHFAPTGKHVDEIPLEKLIVPLIIVDVSSKVNDNASFVLYKHHLDNTINFNNGEPCAIFFRFGWSKYYSLGKDIYLGYDHETEKLNFPGLSAEVAEWITSTYKNVVGIGVDVASLDPGSSEDYPVHINNAAAGIFNLENLNMSRPIPESGCSAFILPMKISAGTGAPTRVVAICPKQT